MPEVYTVKLGELIDEFALTPLFLPEGGREIEISRAEVYRPGLPLSGFFEHYDPAWIQILGRAECAYLKQLDQKQMLASLDRLLERKPVTLIIAHDQTIPQSAIKRIENAGVPLLFTKEETSSFMAELISQLNVKLAPRITRHGVFVEVYGEGVLILGDSGVGKSETAVELIKRGHRLIADDAVEIKKTGAKTLVGSAPDNIRHFVELRGIGIVNARRIFGMGAVKLSEKIDMVVELEPWDADKVYDRMGIENESIDILGVSVPYTVVPIKPGRNLAIILEVAAMNNRQKKMGYNAARELMHNLGIVEDVIPQEDELELWSDF